MHKLAILLDVLWVDEQGNVRHLRVDADGYVITRDMRALITAAERLAEWALDEDEDDAWRAHLAHLAHEVRKVLKMHGLSED